MIQSEIFSAIILNDGWINDWIRPCHLQLSALALCPFLLTPLFSSFPSSLFLGDSDLLLPSFTPPPPPSFQFIRCYFSSFILPCQAYVSRGCCFINKEPLIELFSPASACSSSCSSSCNTCVRACTHTNTNACRFTFFCCVQKGGHFCSIQVMTCSSLKPQRYFPKGTAATDR